MTIKRLLYIANARLPTEKAHGYQICKMCEAFAYNGVKVQLWHSYRYQSDPNLGHQSVFDYYGVCSVFQVKTVRNWDVLRLERFLSARMFMVLFFVHGLIWGLYVALAARKENADVYYTRDIAVAYWLLKLGLPTFYEGHTVPKRAQRHLLYRIAKAKTLCLVLVLTPFIKERFVKMGFPEGKIIVLPDGVDLSLFSDLPTRDECRRRLGLPQDRLIAGYIGRFRTMEMEKGIPQLIQGMPYLPSLCAKEPLLLCVGGPMDAVPYYLDLARLYSVPNPRLKFIDRVPNRDVPLWMRACDVLTIPWGWTEFSAYFTSPLKLFEYMAAGVPIVAADLPSLREVLRDEENALLVTPGNPKQFCGEIARLLKNPVLSERIARCAAQDVRQYSWERRAYQILEQSMSCRKALV